MIDPSGLEYQFAMPGDKDYDESSLTFVWINSDGSYRVIWKGGDIDSWFVWAQYNVGEGKEFSTRWVSQQPGYILANGNKDIFWALQAIRFLCTSLGRRIAALESSGRVRIIAT